MSPFTATADGVRIRVRVQPRASRSEIVGLHGAELKVRITAPPADGAANAALVRFLARSLDVPASAVTIVSGHRARSKLIEVSGVTVERAAGLHAGHQTA